MSNPDETPQRPTAARRAPTRKCKGCGQRFYWDDVLTRGWLTIGPHYCVCDICQDDPEFSDLKR